jgi:predicted N-acetyltransferase YhbS
VLENTLIARAEQTQQAHFKTVNSDTELVMDVMSGDKLRHEVLTQRSYHVEQEPYLNCTIRALNVPIPESILPAGYQIRSSTEADVEQVCAVHMSAFGSTWTTEEYLSTMRTPGFDPAREIVVVAPDGRFAAFLIYWPDPVSKSGLFEPVGCATEFQRQGLTRALMYEGMRRMVAAGMTHALVNHEVEALNPASGPFYKAVGFSYLFDYRKAAKKLK